MTAGRQLSLFERDDDFFLESPTQVIFRGRAFRCASGRGGIKAEKSEGDGVTPVGTFPLRQVFYRPDRVMRPSTLLPTIPLHPEDGWCDDPRDLNYNCWIKRPYNGGHERLWREDPVYDLIVVVGYNDCPVVPTKGSAIFLHIVRDDFAPTAGCLAFSREDLQEILLNLQATSQVVVGKEWPNLR